jgi:hypothetical protein
MGKKSEAASQPAWPVQFGRAGACEYLSTVYQIPMTQTALAMHDSRGTGPERRIILNRTYYLRVALDQWMAERGARGARRRRHADAV